MEDDNEIDQLFKNGLSEPDIPFNEADWEKMAKKLDRKGRRRTVPLLMLSAAAAAAVVLVIFWFQFRPLKPAGNQLKSETAAARQSGLNRAEPLPSIKRHDAPRLTEKLALVKVVIPALAALPVEVTEIQSADYSLSIPATLHNAAVMPVLNKSNLPEPTDSASLLARKANALAMSQDPAEKKKRTGNAEQFDLNKSIRKGMSDMISGRNNLILSAIAAPDITTAKASTSSKISSNVGVLATYALGKKISLTSGALYAKKYYNSAGTSGSTYSTGSTAWEVYADCNVLDVPLNVNYKLISGSKLTVSVNTGLSSYFMLKEKYDYVTVLPNGTNRTTSTEISNQNQHLLGIANVAVSFDHRIADNLSVGVQPFAKLPLTGIGYGDASLKSVGMSFSLNIGLFPVKKPGKYASLR